MLQLVKKMSIFDNINNALTVDIFENVFQRTAVELFLVNVLKVKIIHKYVLYCEQNITGNACWLVFTRK